MNPDGSGLATIASGSTAQGERLFTSPVWSRDGGSLSFSSLFVFPNNAVQSAYHRADADGTGDIVTLAFDNTFGAGVGPGIPHFSSWSPDGNRIALTTSGEFGIGTMVFGSYSGQSPRGIALGAPLYVNWAPVGTALLVHQETGLHMTPVTDLGAGFPTLIETGSMSYFSPSCAPDSKSFVHSEFIDGENTVVLTQKDDITDQSVITEGDLRVGLGWSPDSSKIAIVEDSAVVEFPHAWSVIDIESGLATTLVTQFASDNFFFVQNFFDQYLESHNIWSPDSDRILITGAILDLEQIVQPDGTVELPKGIESEVWTIDAAGIDDPISVGMGTIASWSPQ